VESPSETDHEPFAGLERVLHVQILNVPTLHGVYQHHQERGAGWAVDPGIFFHPPILDRSLPPVYDIDVEDNHNFFADGILVHNCDEFQDLQRLQAIQTILVQARSQGLCLVLSHQTTAQLDDTLFKIIVTNASIQGAGRVSGEDAARLARSWDLQYSKEVKQALVTQPDFTWTFRLRAGPGEEQSPPVQERLVQPPQENHSKEEVQAFLAKMRVLYGADRTEGSVFDQDRDEKPEWMGFLLPGQPVPSKEAWRLLITEEAPPRLRIPSL
jgi:hypothetical protein